MFCATALNIRSKSLQRTSKQIPYDLQPAFKTCLQLCKEEPKPIEDVMGNTFMTQVQAPERPKSYRQIRKNVREMPRSLEDIRTELIVLPTSNDFDIASFPDSCLKQHILERRRQRREVGQVTLRKANPVPGQSMKYLPSVVSELGGLLAEDLQRFLHAAAPAK